MAGCPLFYYLTGMKSYKYIDAWGSALLIALSLVLLLTPYRGTVMALYFVVGAWQLVSAGVHLAKGWGTSAHRPRYVYQWTIVVILVLFLFGFVWGSLLFLLMAGLLFLGPVLAFAYTILCFYELKQLDEETSADSPKQSIMP